MSTVARIAAVAAVGVVLAACAAGGARVQPVYIGSYDPEMLNYAASKGAMLTEVVGNPFGAPKERVDAAVIGSMTGAHFGPRLAFTTKAPPDYASPYRIVMFFNPAPNAQAIQICSNADQPTAAQPNELRMLAAFCSSDTVVTSIKGSVADVTAPTDSAFRGLIRSLMVELFPPRDPDLGGGRDPAWID